MRSASTRCSKMGLRSEPRTLRPGPRWGAYSASRRRGEGKGGKGKGRGERGREGGEGKERLTLMRRWNRAADWLYIRPALAVTITNSSSTGCLLKAKLWLGEPQLIET